MAFLVLGANSVSGYTVKNSLRFNNPSSDYLVRTTSSQTAQKFTFSCWFKLGFTSRRTLFATDYQTNAGTGGQSGCTFSINTDSKLYIVGYGGAVALATTQLFRDPSAWYHIVWASDTTQATDSNRWKLYLNGSQITSVTAIYGTSAYPPQNQNIEYKHHSIGSYSDQATYGAGQSWSNFYDGYISEAYLVDGQQLDATSFGQTDTDTGIWIPKAYTGTYGTNGFYLKFANSASLGTDSSGNGNTFTVNNLTSIDQTTDTPTNNFCTLDPLNVPTSSSPTFTEGNTKVVTSSGGNFGGSGNIGASKGKWYFEIKFTSGTTTYGNISLSSSSNARESARQNVHSNQLSSAYPNLCYEYDGNVYKDSGASVANYGSYAVGDIIMIAMDLDNQFAYFGRNGTWGNSSVPTSGSSGTGGASLSTNPDFWHLALGDRNSAGTNTYDVNFGNPNYSANSYTDGAGIGNFSYSVPSGYYALCTKNLANYG